jgi:hypothetical protein
VDFTANEPAAGYVIQRIEGSLGLYCDPADVATVNCSWTPPQGSNTISYWAHSSYGDTSALGLVAGGAPIKVDSGAPSVSVSVGTPNGANGWFISPVTAAAAGADSASGIAGLNVNIDGGAWQGNGTVYANQGTHTVRGLARDNAGNTATSAPVNFNLDSVAPTIATGIPAPDGSNGWFKTIPVHLTVSGTDATSGISAAEIQIGTGAWVSSTTSVSEDGTHTINFRSIDMAGNTSSSSATVKVDTTAPTASVNLSGTLGANGWYTTRPVATVSGSDAASGVATGQVNLNGGAWTGSVTVSDGIHTVQPAVTDNAGNASAVVSFTVKVDTIAPTINPSETGTQGNDDWWTTQVVVDPNPYDLTAGIAEIEISVNGGPWQTLNTVTLDKDGLYEVDIRVTDKAGNFLTDQLDYKIDTTDPVCTITQPTSDQMLTGTVNLAGSCKDSGSGVETIVISVDGGNTWQPITSVDGSWSFLWDTVQYPGPVIVKGTDGAGNIEAGTKIIFKIANQGPRIELQEEWFIWNAGTLKIWAGDLPVNKVEISIADWKDRWPARQWTFDDLKDVPGEIKWDRKFADGTLAPIGDYAVRVTVWDAYQRSTTAQGKIIIPPVPQLTVQATAAQSATRKTLPAPTLTATRTVIPTAGVLPSLTAASNAVVEEPVLPVEAAVPPVLKNYSGFLLPFLTMLGLLLALGYQAVRDPRPRAIHQLVDTFVRITELQKRKKLQKQ